MTSQPGAPTGPRTDTMSPTRAPRLDRERAEAIRRLAQSLRDSPPTLRARVVRATTSLVELRAIHVLVDSLVEIDTADRDAILMSTLAG